MKKLLYPKFKKPILQKGIFPVRSFVALFLISLLTIGCNSPAKISGKLQGVENSEAKVYLIQPQSLWQVTASFLGKVIDSSAVAADGSFEFRNLPKTKDPVLLEIALKQDNKMPGFLETEDPQKANYMPVVWNPGKPLHINGNIEEFQKSFSIEQASEVNKALLKLRDIKAKAFRDNNLGKHWEVESGNELLKKEKAILQYQKELMNFANNTDNLLPALVALRWVSVENNYERVPEFLVEQCNRWQKEAAGHAWVQQLCKASAPSNLPVLVGDKFPDLELPTLEKDTVSLKEKLGSKLTIIDLWA
ncbi:MAG: hypothetical protein WBL27_10175, partial [Salinimicrobium sp.]